MKQVTHWSNCCQCEMTFSIYLPDKSSPPPPVLYYLSGLTCTDEQARTKSNFAPTASRLGLAMVFPDTSPRGEGVKEGVDWTLGLGASWYVDSTSPPWSTHYNMFTYVTKELPDLVTSLYPVDPVKRGVTGHSMGGHGALVAHLKNPGLYSSVSALAPICNPSASTWGRKAFSTLLGSLEAGKAYDATELVRGYSGGAKPSLIIDQGTEDWVLEDQLMPDNLCKAAELSNYPVELRMREKFDHSYFFVASFMRDHLEHHARAMGLL